MYIHKLRVFYGPLAKLFGVGGLNGKKGVVNAILFIWLLFPVLLLASNGQQNKGKYRFIVEGQYAAGKVSPMYKDFPKTTFVNAGEIFLGCQTYGERRWNKLFNYPRMGISLIYQNLGNDSIMGHQISAVPTAYFSTTKKEDAKFFAEFRYGLGMAYFTKPYDPVTNPRNAAAGSPFSWQLTLGTNLRWNFSRYGSFQLGAMWYHASNAHTVLPNVGVNTIGAYTGILIYPYGRKTRDHTLDTVALDKKWHVNFRLGAGFHERGSAFGSPLKKKFPVYTIAVYASKRAAKIFMLKAGVMYRYYPMYRDFAIDSNIYTSKLGIRSSSFTIFIGNDFLLGRFAISLEAGINVYKPVFRPFFDRYEKSHAFDFYTKQLIATRFGLNYYILNPYKHPRNNVFVGAYVCANFGQAEFLEFNLGYVF